MGYSSAIAVVLFASTFGLNHILTKALSTHGDY
jgi:ABC-type sugar transport system permease subunit